MCSAKEICPEHELEIGDWPFGSHERGAREGGLFKHTFQPYVDENMTANPITITSPGHRNQMMRDLNIVPRGKKRGMPGQMV